MRPTGPIGPPGSTAGATSRPVLRTPHPSATWAKVLGYCSVVSHFEPFAKGVIDSKDVIFYVTMIFLGLFLTSRSMESLRWRA